MENTVAQMSISDLRQLISDVVSDVVEEKLTHFVDPDAGLEFRDEFKRDLIAQRERLARGEEELIPAEQVYRDLGLE